MCMYLESIVFSLLCILDALRASLSALLMYVIIITIKNNIPDATVDRGLETDIIRDREQTEPSICNTVCYPSVLIHKADG